MSTCNVSTSSNYMQVIIGANNYILQKNMKMAVNLNLGSRKKKAAPKIPPLKKH